MRIAVIVALLSLLMSTTHAKGADDYEGLIGSKIRLFARTSSFLSYPEREPRNLHADEVMSIVDVESDERGTFLIIQNFAGRKYSIPTAYLDKAPSSVIKPEPEPTPMHTPSDDRNIRQHIGKTVWTISGAVTGMRNGESAFNLPTGEVYTLSDVALGVCKASGAKDLCVTLMDADKNPISIPYREFNEYTFSFTAPPVPYNNGRIHTGMTKDEVRRAWGDPEKINKTIYGTRTSEQWVYGADYVYFFDDVCSAIQTSR